MSLSPPHSPTTSPSPNRPISDDDKLPPPSSPAPTNPELSSEPRLSAARNPAFPSREDCWSEEATRTLIDAWGGHYLQLNRGNLRQKHWQEVADAVNALHATSAKLRRTDVQCKNRIDTTKKKFKIEKSKVAQSNGRYVSTWPHFESLDSLIGDSFSKTNTTTTNNVNGHNRNLRRRASPSPESSSSPETVSHHRKSSPTSHNPEKIPAASHLLRLPWSVPVGPRSKRSGAGSVTERNFSVMAAAAAAMEAEEDDEDDDADDEDENSGAWGGRRSPAAGRNRKRAVEEETTVVGEGYIRLAEAITRLGKIYEKVEEAKQRQMVELEKQRMQFAKDLEIQRMKVFMESQVHLEKLKRAKCNSDSNSYL